MLWAWRRPAPEKQAAFGLPWLELIDEGKSRDASFNLAPTREVGLQIAATWKFTEKFKPLILWPSMVAPVSASKSVK